jgi:hypothetical protein
MSNGEELEGYVTLKKASTIAGVSDSRLRQLLNDDARRAVEFPGARKLGHIWMIPTHEVEAFKQRERKTGYPLGRARKKEQFGFPLVVRRRLTIA